MSLFTSNNIVSNTASLPVRGLSDPIEPCHTRPGGLGIEGFSSPSVFEEHNASVEYFENCASADADNDLQQPRETQGSGSESTQSMDKDEYPHRIENRSPSSYNKYLAVSILSTLLSLAYVVIAIWGPTWDKIRDPAVSKNAASIIAKIIEASFGSICVLYLGQLLTRRSTSEDAHHGVSLDQICMRDWIIDPGSMFSDDKVLWLGMKSFLGWYVLVAAVAALLYGTASQNLVQPVVRETPVRQMILKGFVTNSFGDEAYIERKYRSSLLAEPNAITDRSYMSVVYSAQGSDSWNSYLAAWEDVKNHTTIQSQRLAPWTSDRSTHGQINGSWVQNNSPTTSSNRVVNNVTLAIPHPGVLKAARSKSNAIAQPYEFDGGNGRYNLRAQIPSPYINVVCTNIKRSDLEGLVYEDQVNGILPPDALSIPRKQSDYQYVMNFDWSNYATVKTAVDDLFHWTESNQRPIFYRYPKAKQTIINGTIGSLQYNSLGRDSLYLLSAPETNRAETNSTIEYSLCSIQAGLLADCSTELSVAGNSSVMAARCGDPNDRMSYIKRNESAKDTALPAYVAVGSLAATSVGLNNGELGYDADNMNYLTKLILTNATLPSDRPSIAEGLAAFLLPSLIMAAQDSPFDMSSMPPSTSGYSQSFPAILTPTLYASGGDGWYKRLYLIVLIDVFLMNCYMLYYLFLRHRKDLKIDICDPMNLFGLAIASSFNHFPDSKLILSPKKEKSERPLSTEWKILSDPNKKMEIVQVSPVCEAGGRPNDAMRSSGFTPLLDARRWSRGKVGPEANIEMV